MSTLKSLAFTYAEIASAVFSIICIIGVFLPWLIYLNWPYDVYLPNGIDFGYGVYIIFLSLIALALVILEIYITKSSRINAGVIGIGFLITVINLFAFVEIFNVISSDTLYERSIGIGLYLHGSLQILMTCGKSMVQIQISKPPLPLSQWLDFMRV